VDIAHAGELAALATALFFALGPTLFTLAGRRVGSVAVNRLRLLLAAFFLLILHSVVAGTPLPQGAGAERWFWLGLSGLIGLVAGDACLFQAFVLIGTRLTMLVFSLSPLIAALVAWLFLGERLAPLQWLGVVVTLLGVAWVVSDRRGNGREAGPAGQPPPPAAADGSYLRGLLFALGGATGQALGMITAKLGLGGEFPALSAHVIRLGIAALGIWLIAIVQGEARATLRRFREDARALHYTAGGAALGPLFGVWLSLVAIRLAPVGIATTLMALPPVFLLPIGRFVFGETIGARAVLGTLLAVAGVLLLFLAA
jgi:drug/metabolite transporter (DMT)-like permease